MLKKAILFTTTIALLNTIAMARGHHQGDNQSSTQNINQSNVIVSELTEEQKEGLLFMLEEEKVARDAYISLHQRWGLRTFDKIKNSEQRHMDAIKLLVQKYQLPLPSTLNDIGVFENQELQELYNTLMNKGNLSLKEAIEVGILIEETDIEDLEMIIAESVPSDLQRVYDNLLKGSYKHLRAYNRILDML